MEYECGFVRRHKTRTRPHKVGERSLELPVVELGAMRLEIPGEPPALAGQGDFIAQVLAMVDQHSPFDDTQWNPTDFRGAREYRERVPLPVPLMKEGSLADLLVKRDARQHPTLFYDDAWTRYRIFEQWFMTIGNGMEWREDGLLLHWGDVAPAEQLFAEVTSLLAEEPSSEYQATLADWAEYVDGLQWMTGPIVPVNLYPLDDDYSEIYLLPDNVETSFLAAALDICRYYLSRPAWECFAYAPHYQANQNVSVYRTEAWRDMTLQDGLRYRNKVLDAYTRIVQRFGGRFAELGYVEETFFLDSSLPPVWIPPLKR